jgi:tetratricopeptide (TPR) repeat protein
MSKRTRSHQLEEESWRELNNAIPTEWVLRKPQPDYGVDGEIEIFDKNDSSTGLMFLVQLKGTDETDKKKALSYRLPIEKVEDYKSYQLPVLLVRYHSPSKSLFLKWATEIDLHFAYKKKSKSISINFPPGSLWTEQASTRIIEDISAFHLFRSPRLPLPIRFKLSFPSKEVYSMPIGKVEALIRSEATSLSKLISFDEKWEGITLPRITVANELIQVNLMGLAAFNLHINKYSYATEDAKSQLPHDVLMGIAIFLHRLGHDNFAAEISHEHLEKSSLTNNFTALTEVVSCLLNADRVDLALGIAEKMLSSGKNNSFYQLLTLPAFVKSKMKDEEFESLKRLLLKAASQAITSHAPQAGACYLNLGRKILRREGGTKEALHYFRLAAKYDPNYKGRDYYLYELGGLLYYAKRYNCSAAFYEIALRKGAPVRSLALRADVLMLAGRYKEAYEAFKEYENKVDKMEDEWLLKLCILDDLIRNYNFEKQNRQPYKALNYAAVPVVSDMTPKEIDDRLAQALSLDALCAMAWFNKGEIQAENHLYCEAASSYLTAAVMSPQDSELWAKASLCILNCKEYLAFIPSILSMVIFYSQQESFIKELSRIIEKQPDDRLPKSSKIDMINAFNDIIRETMKAIGKTKKEEKDFAWRMINPDGTYRQL